MAKNISGATPLSHINLNDTIKIPLSGGYFSVTLGELAKYICSKCNDNSGTPIGYDTTLSFSTNATDSKVGVTASISGLSTIKKVMFNSISNRLGLPQTMNIYKDNINIMVIDFLSDYLNKPCLIELSAQEKYLTTFSVGNLNLDNLEAVDTNSPSQ